MNIFQETKSKVDIINVARMCGVEVNSHNKALCCFHKEKTPSLSFNKEKQIYKCFSCGKSGDVISLVQELLNISPLESAKYLNQALGLGIEINGFTPKYEINKYKQNQDAKERFKIWHNKTLQMLIDYMQSLKSVEKLQKQEILDYYIDLLIYGTEEDILWFKKTEERWCREIEEKFRNRNVGTKSTL